MTHSDEVICGKEAMSFTKPCLKAQCYFYIQLKLKYLLLLSIQTSHSLYEDLNVWRNGNNIEKIEVEKQTCNQTKVGYSYWYQQLNKGNLKLKTNCLHSNAAKQSTNNN